MLPHSSTLIFAEGTPVSSHRSSSMQSLSKHRVRMDRSRFSPEIRIQSREESAHDFPHDYAELRNCIFSSAQGDGQSKRFKSLRPPNAPFTVTTSSAPFPPIYAPVIHHLIDSLAPAVPVSPKLSSLMVPGIVDKNRCC